MPRTSPKERRRALAARIAKYLFQNVGGQVATRLVMVDESFGEAKVAGAKDLGGWSELAVRDILEAHLRPGQRRRSQ